MYAIIKISWFSSFSENAEAVMPTSRKSHWVSLYLQLTLLHCFDSVAHVNVVPPFAVGNLRQNKPGAATA